MVVFLVSAWVPMMLGCGAASEDDGGASETLATAESALTTPVHHVVLASGGFGSCEPTGPQGVLPTELRPLVQEIERRSAHPATVVRTCFGGVGDVSRFDFVITRGTLTLRAGGTTLSHLEGMLRDLLVDELPSRLDVYGHSHGGWLAGKVVEDLGPGTADSFTLNVFLSDAISRTLCTPQVVISGNGRADACGRFPLDLSPSTLRRNVRGYLGTAFQSDDWLRSSPVPGVENRPLNPGQPRVLRALNHRALFGLPLTLGLVAPRFQYL